MALICEYPVLQIRPYGLLVYCHKEFTKWTGEKKERKSVPRDKYTGSITAFSRKKLKRSISLLVACSEWKEATNFKTGKIFKFKVNFITFTLPAAQEDIPDKKIKVCLDNWIKRARRKYKLQSYVWRAERQVNGNIHFHMITDVWIHYQKIRDDWNEVLKSTGLIKKFSAIHKHENPNSTDVHAVWKVKNLTQYFVKYMSKDDDRCVDDKIAQPPWREPRKKKGKGKQKEEFKRLMTRKELKIKGKVWDCSVNLKTKINCWMMLEGEVRDRWDEIVQDESIELLNDANFRIAFMSEEEREKRLPEAMKSQWKDYLKAIRTKEL